MHVPPELVESCKRGDPGAFDELVRLTYRTVYSLAHRIVGNPDDAADVVQDTYIRAWRSIRGFRGDANVATWLYRVTANTALTHLKRRGRSGVVAVEEMPDVPVDDRTEQQADAAVLDAALATLPAGHRAVVLLKDVYGLTCEEIADEMGTTEGAIKVRLFRARQRLADALAAQGVVVPMKSKRKRTS